MEVRSPTAEELAGRPMHEPKADAAVQDEARPPLSPTSWLSELHSQRDVVLSLSKQLAKELEIKRATLGGRAENAQRLCAEAESKLLQANREYQAKHVRLRKKMLTVVMYLGATSFVGWLICACMAAQRYPLAGVVSMLPITGGLAAVVFHLYGEAELVNILFFS